MANLAILHSEMTLLCRDGTLGFSGFDYGTLGLFVFGYDTLDFSVCTNGTLVFRYAEMTVLETTLDLFCDDRVTLR